MKGWRKIKIEDLGKVMTGNTPPRKNPELYGSHTLFIKPTDVSEDTRYTLNPEECYSELGYKKYIKSLIPKGATCVVTIGSIGKKITQAHCNCFINQAMNAVIPSENFDPNFVYYLLKHNLHSVKALDSGTASGRENVSKSSFSSIEVYVPVELSVQVAIGETLNAYDELIQNNLKRIELAEEAAKIIYKTKFGKYQSDSAELPKGWEIKTIGEVYGKLESGSRPKGGIDKNLKVGVPSVGAESVNGLGKYSYQSEKLITDFFFAKMNRGKVENKDILIYKDGAYIGKTTMFQDSFPHKKFCVNEHVFLLRAKEFDFQNYLFFTLYQPLYFEKIQNLNTNSAQPGINQESLKSLKLIYPNQETAKEFNEKVEPLLKLINALALQNTKLRESRDILLPRLMTGSINLKIAETKIVSIAQPKQKEATWEFKEAVLISLLTEKFGNEKFPLGRKRYTKLSYLFHRHADNQMQNYLRKAAGPYNPKTKYAGPEKIAHQNGYVADHKNGNLTGFIAGKNISAAKTYFENYWSIDYLNWLDTNFHYKSNDQLELYATVDNAMLELHEANKTVNVEAVKQIIKTEKEWKAKLEREIFNDANIQKAITYLPTLFQYS